MSLQLAHYNIINTVTYVCTVYLHIEKSPVDFNLALYTWPRLAAATGLSNAFIVSKRSSGFVPIYRHGYKYVSMHSDT